MPLELTVKEEDFPFWNSKRWKERGDFLFCFRMFSWKIKINEMAYA